MVISGRPIMNILYLSHLSGASYAGPTYSVPKQIEAQSKLDNVFWYNATRCGKEEWKEIPYYHDLSEFPEESINSLPEPFNHPDIIVVELFYNMTKSRLRGELVSGNIPYIIIPRGELTKQAQERKGLKKWIANILICNKYAKKAAAIQFLTEQEYQDSGDSWNKNHIIVPNGIDLPARTKEHFNKNGIKCVSIGRIEPYQKGLDLLIEACSQIKEELSNVNCTITICGPDKEQKLQTLKELVNKEELNEIIEFRDGVYGREKERLLLESDVFLLTSRFEGHPMALVEALSYGLPCVATTGSNMRKEIDSYRAGWTADCTSEKIASALKEMISEKNEFLSYSNNAKQLSKEYSWQLIAEKQRRFLSWVENT
jgi:glycosyltransferase involved in cell wall biosynthesis